MVVGRLARRRLVLAGPAALAGAAAPSVLRAADLLLTPPQTEGPFYPVELPSDRDADLVRVTGADARAMGTVTHVTGRVLDRASRPLPGVLVEIWQCDANGRYRHPLERGGRPLDPGFQGYGRALTDKGGGYRFRTIRPVPYPGRTPHIHFAINQNGLQYALLTRNPLPSVQKYEVRTCAPPLRPGVRSGIRSGSLANCPLP